MLRALVTVAILAALGVAAYVAYDRFYGRYAVEREDNIALSKVLTATFAKSSALRVGTLSGIVQSAASDTRGYAGILSSDQVIKAPYSVDYFVDVSRLSLDDYRYDRASRTLTVRVPEVAVAQANVDEANMTLVRRRGIFITRQAFDALARTSSARAQRVAQARANEPEQIARAQENARTALAQLLRGPLTAAGIGGVTLVVRFPTGGAQSADRWDESRSLANVLAETP